MHKKNPKTLFEKPNILWKITNVTFQKLCVNVMNMNIKIQNIFYIVKVSKYLQPSSRIQQKLN
jgi:hypothetical protein